MNRKQTLLFFSLILVFIAACQPTTEIETVTEPEPTQQSIFEAVETAVPPPPLEASIDIVEETAVSFPSNTPAATLTIDVTNSALALNRHILGTNLPAWLTDSRFSNTTFQERIDASGVTLIRIPGGSWSNAYDWLACERDGTGIDGDAVCYWTWAATPTDFLNLLRTTDIDGMYTINMNGTAKEAAALVAFFNGSVTDNTIIGVDVKGRDWGMVSDWAQLRSDNGNPKPIGIQYWEIGNEIYGGKQGQGTDCSAFGWEDVWTCDGAEYVNGIGSGANRHEGFIEYSTAMKAVDPTIWIGAVGVPFQNEWSNWGNEVIAEAGDVMDFYIIHQYGFFNTPSSNAEALAEPHTTWPAIAAGLQTAYDTHASGRDIPVAVTEFNMFSVQDQDNTQMMTRMVNALYIADSLGLMMANGIDLAAQWDFANGQASNGTDYGLINADSYERYPQYYAYVLWSRFGDHMLSVSNPHSAESELSLYAGIVNGDSISVMAINKTGNAISDTIVLENSADITGVYIDELTAVSLDAQSITFNGNSNPAADFSDAPSAFASASGNSFNHTFAPYSITLLRLELDLESTMLPVVVNEGVLTSP